MRPRWQPSKMVLCSTSSSLNKLLLSDFAMACCSRARLFSRRFRCVLGNFSQACLIMAHSTAWRMKQESSSCSVWIRDTVVLRCGTISSSFSWARRTKASRTGVRLMSSWDEMSCSEIAVPGTSWKDMILSYIMRKTYSRLFSLGFFGDSFSSVIVNPL